MPLLIAVFTLLLLAACGRETGDVVMVGTLERHRLELAANAPEPVLELAVREGDLVKKGEVVVQLDAAQARSQRDTAAADVAQAKHRLSGLVNGPRGEEILEARARLDATDADLQRAQSEFQRLANLQQSRAISQSDFDSQRGVRDRAAAIRREAQAVLAALLKGTRVEELDQARAALTAADSRLQVAEIDLARLTVLAPQDARVEALPFRPGERPAKGATVAVLLASELSFARVYVPEALRARVSPGSQVSVKVDGIEATFTGTVRYIAGEASFTPYFALTQKDRGRLAYVAEIDLPDSARNLPVGVPLEAHIH
ncbi:MAG: HlyD family efflux transporter periplasmic adaptor subunit [Steroidobacteraceae bacterium]